MSLPNFDKMHADIADIDRMTDALLAKVARYEAALKKIQNGVPGCDAAFIAGAALEPGKEP